LLAFPVAVAAGFAIVQWWQVRASGAESASWWHLAAIPAAVFIWLVWPTAPGALAPAGNARTACVTLLNHAAPTPECLSRAAQAMDNRDLVWWLTGALILAAVLLAPGPGSRRGQRFLPRSQAACWLRTFLSCCSGTTTPVDNSV
jgi:hypothetical protein